MLHLREVAPAEDVLGNAPEFGGLLVLKDLLPSAVHNQDAVERGVHQGLKKGCFLGERLLGLLPLSDVLVCAITSDSAAHGILEDPRSYEDVAGFAVTSDDAMLSVREEFDILA